MGQHRHAHDPHAHAGLHLGRGAAPVHRIGRRRFLVDLGRRTFAIAVVGGVIAACSSDDDQADPEVTAATGGASATTPAGGSNGLRWAQADLGFVSAYVLVRGNEAAVVDTGAAGSADRIGDALSTVGATYDDVHHVVLTHSHPDHVGSLPDVLERSATGAAAYAGEADIPNISTRAELRAVGDGDDVFGLRVIHTPGHTPGSISLFDPGIGLLVAGDALTGNDDGTALAGPDERFTSDLATAEASVAELATLDVEAVAMGHGRPVESGAGPLLAALTADL